MSEFREDNSDDMRALELIKELYIGIEQPFATMSTDGVTRLIVPPTIKKVFPIPESHETVTTQEVRGTAGVPNA